MPTADHRAATVAQRNQGDGGQEHLHRMGQQIFRDFVALATVRMNRRDSSAFKGACQFIVEGAGKHSCHHVVRGDGELVLLDGIHPSPSVTIRMHVTIAEAIAAKDLRTYDFRDPGHFGKIDIQGDLGDYRAIARHFFGLRWDRQFERFDILDVDQLWDDAAQRSRSIGSVSPIQRLTDPSPKVIGDLLSASRPAVLTWSGQSDRFDANQPVLEDLVSRFGSVSVSNTGEASLSFGEFVQRVRSGGAAGTAALLVPDGMRAALLPPIVIERVRWIPPLLWFGARGQATGLHRDPYTNFNFNLVGRKMWRLYSPDQHSFLYPRREYPGYQPCHVDPERPDLVAYPEFVNASALEVVVQPNEGILVPVGWFHHVSIVDQLTLSVGMGALAHGFPQC